MAEKRRPFQTSTKFGYVLFTAKKKKKFGYVQNYSRL